MARRHGWAGSPPVDDRDARARIIKAAITCVDRDGPEDFSLSVVAAELGVIRQTVYRYYASTGDLFAAVGHAAVESFLDDISQHLRHLTRPADWVVEALATAIEWLPERRHLTLLLVTGRAGPFAERVTSADSMKIGRELFERAPIDWPGLGYEESRLSELIELMLRILQSMTLYPPDPPRDGSQLRDFLRHWIAPALLERP